MTDALPVLPIDDVSLDLYWSALHPDETADRTSLLDVLDMMSRLAGSDPEAVEEHLSADVVMMRDAQYHPNDLIVALVAEVRLLRGALVSIRSVLEGTLRQTEEEDTVLDIAKGVLGGMV